MNKNKNLYKLDDIFLIISYILAVFLLYTSRSVIIYILNNKEGISDFVLNFIILNNVKLAGLVSSIIFLQILGRVIRREEKILVTILDTVIMYKTISINQLQQNMDMNRVKLEKYINKLSNIGGLNISFDGTYIRLDPDRSGVTGNTENRFENTAAFSSQLDSISEGSKSESTTGSFSKVQEQQISVSSKEDLNNILSGIKDDDNKGVTAKKPKFNLILFLFLFFVFWPGAFIYFTRYHLAVSKASVVEERVKKRLREIDS